MGKEEAKNCSMGTKKPRRTLLCRAQGGGGRFGRLGQPRGLGQWSLSRGRPPKGCSHYQFGVFSMSQAQKQQLFTGRYKDFIVTLRIEPGEDFLAVFVQDPSTTEVFIQKVTAKFLQSSQTLSGFKSYVELYEFLTNNFAQVAFVSNALKFEYNGKTAFVDLVLKVRSNFPEGLNSSDNPQIEAQIAAHKKALQAKIQAHQDKFKAQIAVPQNNISSLEKEGKQIKTQIITRQNEIQKQIKIASDNIQAAKKKHHIPAFYNNPANPHMFYYTVAVTGQTTAKLVRQSAPSTFYYNFVNGTKISKSQKVKYSIRATKINNFPPMVGFCTRSGNGRKQNHTFTESVYYSYSGWMNVDGVPNDIHSTAKNQDLIECEVDLKAKTPTMKWWKNSVQIENIKVPQSMLEEKTLFLSILLWDGEDSLDLAVVPIPA